MSSTTHNAERIDEEVCRGHWQMLVGHAMRKGTKPDDACEAVQELFLKMLESGQYETLGGYAPEQRGVWLRRKLDWHLVNRHRERVSQRRGGACAHVALEDAPEVAGGETPELLHDRGVLAAALQRAGVSEEVLWPVKRMTAAEKTRLCRWKRGLRRRFQHFLT